MARVSYGGKGKTLYIDLSIYPCGKAKTTTNLTISCPDKDTKFKTTLSEKGVNKFREYILDNMKRAGLGAIIAPTTNINLLRKETSP